MEKEMEGKLLCSEEKTYIKENQKISDKKKIYCSSYPRVYPLINTELPQINKDQQHNWKISRETEHSSYKK